MSNSEGVLTSDEAPARSRPHATATGRAAFLEGPIVEQILGLAWPVLVVLALQTFVGVAETYFVSYLGTDALAGVVLVFPLFMLMGTMSNGGIGGGVASAVARALGGRRMHDAQALALHAVVTGAVFGAAFTIGVWFGGPQLFRHMGADGEVLANAVRYADVLFLSAIPAWIASLLAAVLRGAGNVRIPAIVTAGGSLVTLALSPLFIFGWGWIPAFGVGGAAFALVCLNVSSAVVLTLYMRSPNSLIRLCAARLEWRLFRDILKVGLLSAIGTIMSSLAVVITTGLAGAYGREAIAGYGLASRLDYVLIPLLFSLGTASVTMVGRNIGAGQHERAYRIAWIGALLAAAATGAIGFAAALFPGAWMLVFSHDARVVELGAAYFVRVAPFYALFGVGLSLYFASQGAGRMAWPFMAGLARLMIVIVAGGLWIKVVHGSVTGLYWVVAASYLVFGSINAYAMRMGGSWRRTHAAAASMPERADAGTRAAYEPS
jgi:MATE family, multidrug efflux pump